ncbi:hypothetical protein F383_38760 [Gossypium arboreum]|uniref:Uncharacterized protein n=1 Tax=Gossypium arboreum TaxID=29729 RepID=A0A0B0MIA9_GOSAR|nr:hypothetical protein F383_38760 [Gossypium arboreum]
MNPASEMNQSTFLESWNALKPSKLIFSELDSTWARQGHARVQLLQAVLEPAKLTWPCSLPAVLEPAKLTWPCSLLV